MKALKLSALLLGAILFLGLGSSTLSAEGMKCGSGKCGGEKAMKQGKCGDGKAMKQGKCGDGKAMKPGKCGDGKAMKPGKCGGEKAAPKKAMKCGAGKCGSN
jgi:uncharacterized low-complexity protein